MYRVELTSRAQHELDSIRGKGLERIVTALRSLAVTPRPRGVKKLKGPIHRIRAGDWRIIYAVFDKDSLVVVGKIARRSERTYKGLNGLL